MWVRKGWVTHVLIRSLVLELMQTLLPSES
jgi:hypothetical protein